MKPTSRCAAPAAAHAPASDTDCFQFGGYTSGGVPELMAIDAPVARTAIEEIQ